MCHSTSPPRWVGEDNRRGIAFPIDHTERPAYADGAPEPRTFQQVLDGLSKLAEDLRAGSGDGCQR